MLQSSYITFENPVNAEDLLEQLETMAPEGPYYDVETERVEMQVGEEIEDPVLETELADCYRVLACYKGSDDSSFRFDKPLGYFYIDEWNGKGVATAATVRFQLQEGHLDQLRSNLNAVPNPEKIEGY